MGGMGNTYDIILQNGTRVDVSSWLGSSHGHKMQVPADATTALDVPGHVNSELEFVPNRGAGSPSDASIISGRAMGWPKRTRAQCPITTPRSQG